MEPFSNISDPLIQNKFETVYSPSDDTYLLLDYFKKAITLEHFDGLKLSNITNILDMGTGTGILAIFFQKLTDLITNFNPKIYASDILSEALVCAKSNEKLNNINNKIQFIQSDLFNSFPDKFQNSFDIIIFNPPYLPSIEYHDSKKKSSKLDISWDGGPKGYELFLRFIKQFQLFIKLDSSSFGYYISSSHTDLDELNIQIEKYKLFNEILLKKHVSFEDIFLNRLSIR
jgi:release factor glutamine methyltransferase